MHNKKDSNKNNTFIQGLRPFSRSIPHGLKKLLKKGSYNFSNIIDNWSKMVGKDISNICYPNTIKMDKKMNNGALILNVIHGNELTIEYSKQEIIDKINSFFGFKCIKEIKLKIVQEEKKNKKELSVNEVKANYNNKLNNINNEILRNSLNKLIEAYNAKNN
jgi:hypothetical protein